MMIEKEDGSIYDGVTNVRKKDGKSHGNIQELNREELEKFRLINIRLMEYEKIMRQETEELFSYAQARVDDEDDIVRNFELIINLYFYLDENDSAYIEDFCDSDNIMTILRTEKSAPLQWDWGVWR